MKITHPFLRMLAVFLLLTFGFQQVLPLAHARSGERDVIFEVHPGDVKDDGCKIREKGDKKDRKEFRRRHRHEFEDREHSELKTKTFSQTSVSSEASSKKAALAVAAKKALVLYDAPSGAAFKKLGQVYAIMLRNLLGHFEMDVALVPIESYAAGQVEGYDTIFYLGSYYDNPVPQVLLEDMVKTTKTVVWFKYNIWQLAWNSTLGFPEKFGFTFTGLRGLNATPTAANPNPGFFDTVVYKGKSLVKFYQFDAATNTVKADPEIGLMQINDAVKAQVKVVINNPVTQESAPYIIQSANFWYVADLPLTFIGPRDRYLALCDILHDMVGIPHSESHQAMVRLEDVGALVDLTSMRQLSNYLNNQKIPFSIATIPLYRDPLGKYNGGIPMEVTFKQATTLLSALKFATARGGTVIMHGYTHQYSDVPNPHTGVSADDFEFWNIVTNSPVAEDSVLWAAGRFKAGLADLKGSGYTATIFEFPHYQGSPKSYQAAGQSFATRYERAFYYTSDSPNLNLDVNNPDRDFAAGQFFPYIIHKDYYGHKVLPENLGNVEYPICHIDPTSCVDYGWQELHTNAQYALVIRDGFASFFFHPFWLEPELNLPALSDFRKLVRGITALGYKWVGPAQAK